MMQFAILLRIEAGQEIFAKVRKLLKTLQKLHMIKTKFL